MSEDFEQLRRLIRELDISWLDEELDEIILTGKLRPKEVVEKNKKSVSGLEQVAYSDREQLEILIAALRNYFVVLPRIQSETAKALSESLSISNASFKESDNSEFQKIDSSTQKLESLLNQIKG